MTLRDTISEILDDPSIVQGVPIEDIRVVYPQWLIIATKNDDLIEDVDRDFVDALIELKSEFKVGYYIDEDCSYVDMLEHHDKIEWFYQQHLKRIGAL
jgi:hypothetical protein